MNERLLRASTWLKALAGLAGVGVLTAVYQGVVGGLSYDVLRDHADWLSSPVPLPAWADVLVLGLFMLAAYLVGRFLHGPVVVAEPVTSPIDREAAAKEEVRAAFRELGVSPTLKAGELLNRLTTPLQELGWTDELKWCRKELKGYDPLEHVPPYREVSVSQEWKPYGPPLVNQRTGQTGLPPSTTRSDLAREPVSMLTELAWNGSSRQIDRTPLGAPKPATQVEEIASGEYRKVLHEIVSEASDRILTRARR